MGILCGKHKVKMPGVAETGLESGLRQEALSF